MGAKRLDEQLAETIAAVKAAPTDASLRMKLFRLFAVTGQWERARAALDAASNTDPSLAMTTVVYGHAISCELVRAEVFAGDRMPLALGEPPQWLGWMMQAMQASPSDALSLRNQALEEASAAGGQCNDKSFAWIADADSRIGPACELFMDGKYYWTPFTNIESISIPEPTDMLDLVWAEAELTFAGGGTKPALIPVRYAGSEASEDEAIRLGKRTEWTGTDDTGYAGLGQREWATDSDQFALLDVREVALQPASE